MREQHVLTKLLPAASNFGFDCVAAQRISEFQFFPSQTKWHQSGPWLDQPQAESSRKIVCEAARTYLWNREAARSKHQSRRAKVAAWRLDAKKTIDNNCVDLHARA